MEIKYEIRVMTTDDYEEVHNLWMSIHGFAIRSIDDSKEGVERFIKRNPKFKIKQLRLIVLKTVAIQKNTLLSLTMDIV